MTSAPAGTSLPNTLADERSPLAVPLIVWLLIQLTAVALAASGVRLAAHFPSPPQSLAVQEMLIAQFVGSALFLPLLFRGWRSWLAMVVTAIPMLMLAARLSRWPVSGTLLLWTEVAAWLTALALWRAALPLRRDLLAALALLLSAGGLLVWYLREEFTAIAAPLNLLPLVGALRTMGDSDVAASPLLSTVALCAAAIVILAWKSIFRRQEKRSPQT